MKFTIREILSDSVIVDFEDSSWAQVPIDSTCNDMVGLVRRVNDFAPKANPWAESAPVTVGEKVDPALHQALPQAPEMVTYADARLNAYPSIEDQMDALYWARQGDSSKQEEIDAKISAVKTKYPKDWPTRTRAEFLKSIVEE